MTDDEKLRYVTLLGRAWYRLSICVCVGEPGSTDYIEHQRLLDDIDALLPLCKNMKNDGGTP